MMTISKQLMSQTSQYLSKNLGWHFPSERWPDLERGLRDIARRRQFETVEACIEWFLAGATAERIEALALQFTVGETYFNREIRSLEVLEEHVLPELIRARRGNRQQLRIWSAGCCTGEEAYSIAILLDRMIPDPENWNITILGTDINPHFLEKARSAIYSQWSFRGAPQWMKDRYFVQQNDCRFEILPRIKLMVRLAQLNLAEDVLPEIVNETSEMDLILCRNVLIYFSPEGAKKLLNRFHRSLSSGGCLVLSQTETLLASGLHFAALNFPGAVLFRKIESSPLQPEPIVQDKSVWFHPQADTSVQNVSQWPSSQSSTEYTSASSDEFTAHLNPVRATGAILLTPEAQLLLYEEGRYAELAQAAQPSDSSDNLDPIAMRLLAKACANQGKYDDAVEWIEKAVSADKLDAGSYYLQATILQEQSRIDDAIMCLNRAIYLEPDFVIAHFALGNLFVKQSRFQQAKKSFGIALALLQACGSDESVPETDHITTGRLIEIITSIIPSEAFA